MLNLIKRLFPSSPVVKDFLKFSLGTWGGAILSFITVPIVTRLIMPAEFGKASMFILAFNLLLRFCYLGADQALVRHFHIIRREELPKFIWNTLLAPAILLLIVTFYLIIDYKRVSLALYDAIHFESIAVLCLLLVVGIFKDHTLNLIRMENQGLKYSTIVLIENIVNASIIIGYASFVGPTFYAITHGLLFSYLCSLMISAYYTRHLWSSGLTLSRQYITSSLSYGLPFVPAFMFSWVLQGMDRILIKHFGEIADVGIYASAFKIIAILQLLKTGFQNFWIPLAFESYENNLDNRLFLSKMAKSIFPVVFILAVLIILLKGIVILLLGEEYHKAVVLVPFLIFIPLVGILKELTGKGIDFAKKTYWHILITFLIASLNLILNFILIPRYSVVGAAIATSFAYIVYLAINTMLSQKYYVVDYGFKRIIALILTLYTVVLLDYFVNITLYIPYIALIIITIYLFKDNFRTLHERGKS